MAPDRLPAAQVWIQAFLTRIRHFRDHRVVTVTVLVQVLVLPPLALLVLPRPNTIVALQISVTETVIERSAVCVAAALAEPLPASSSFR